MGDILQEVLNDAKDEKRILIFRRFLPIIVVITLLIAVSIIISNWYSNKMIQQRQKTGDVFVDILDNNDSPDILEDFIKNSDNRQAQLGALFSIEKFIISRNRAGAYERIEEILAEKSYNNFTKSYAHLLWLSMILEEKSLSDQQKTKARDHIQYFSDSKQLFFANATILKSLFYQKIKENEMALKYAETALNLPNVSEIIKDQAKSIIANIKYYQVK